MNKHTILSLDTGKTIRNIYIISQPELDDKKVIIHPFLSGEKFLQYLKDKKINIISDKRVELNELKKIKAAMYEIIRKSLIESNDGDVFWYRILGAIIFGLFLFFFAVFVIPDPIPIADEVAIAGLGGVLFYFISRRLNLFNFASPVKIDKYSEYINAIQIFESKPLEVLNEIFMKLIKDIIVEDEQVYTKNDELINTIKNEFEVFTGEELLLIKSLVEIISKNFNFTKIKPDSTRYAKKLAASYFSKERFYFYYLCFKLFNT